MLKEIDPEGSELRRRHRLKRRVYVNQGPDYTWHLDGYDKLKPFGFAIHGAIDGYNRKSLCLKVLRSNNSNIAALYLSCVGELQGTPVKIITDLGTENALAAAIHSFFRQDADAHQYVPSARNQRIECWWSYFCKCCAGWWREFFKYMESTETVNFANIIDTECLWYCFSTILQNDLNSVKDHWNTHRIRKSRF